MHSNAARIPAAPLKIDTVSVEACRLVLDIVEEREEEKAKKREKRGSTKYRK